MKYHNYSSVVLFCLLYDITVVVACVFMAFYVSQGASLWLIFIMVCLLCCTVTPKKIREVEICPKCGYKYDEENTDGDK